MAVELVFEGGDVPPSAALWKAIAAEVLGSKGGRVIARATPNGWEIFVRDASGESIVHPHVDGDFERELQFALRAAGIHVLLPRKR